MKEKYLAKRKPSGLGSIVAMMRAGASIIKSNVFGVRIPQTVLFSVTNRCDNNCAYCYCEDDSLVDLSTKEVKGLISEAASMGCRTIWFIGGEPLLRNDIIDVARHAKYCGLSVSVASNAHLLNEKSGILGTIDHLCVSLDGPEAMHDNCRGEGSFKKAMRGLETAFKKTSLSTHTVLTRHNLNGIDFVIETARKYGSAANFAFVRDCDMSITPDNDECRAVIGRLIEEKKKGAPILASFQALGAMLLWKDYSRVVYGKKETGSAVGCCAGRLYCYVHSNGDVYRCLELKGKTKALNFISSGFREAFKNTARDAGDCAVCNSTCMLDMNYLHSLKFGAVMNYAANRFRYRI